MAAAAGLTAAQGALGAAGIGAMSSKSQGRKNRRASTSNKYFRKNEKLFKFRQNTRSFRRSTT